MHVFCPPPLENAARCGPHPRILLATPLCTAAAAAAAADDDDDDDDAGSRKCRWWVTSS